MKGRHMSTTQNKNTSNIRIKKQTHEQLKILCKREGWLIGGYVDKILKTAILQTQKDNTPKDGKPS
jgi:hypothetical protein